MAALPGTFGMMGASETDSNRSHTKETYAGV